MSSRALLIRDAVIGLIVGTAIGTAAGVWSTRGDTARQPGRSAPTIDSARSRESTAVSGTVGARPTSRANPRPSVTPAAPAQPGPAAHAPVAVADAARAPQAPAVAAEPRPAIAGQLPTTAEAELNRARLLAQRADVNGLIAIRERAARRAQEAGPQESAAAKQYLEQLDRYLTEARTLRLTLDAEEFRKATPKR